MAELDADLFLPASFTSSIPQHHSLLHDLGEDLDPDFEIEIFQSIAPLCSRLLSFHRDLDDPPREIEPYIFPDPDELALLRIYRDIDDPPREFDPYVFPDPIEMCESFQRDSRRPGDDGIRVLGEDLEIGSGYLELEGELGFEIDKSFGAVDLGSGSEDGEAKDGMLEGNREGGHGGEADLALHWDCLRIEEERRDLNDEFEWEDVSGAVLDREDLVLEGERLDVLEETGAVESDSEDLVRRNVGWEVLLAMNGVERNPLSEHEDGESYAGDEQDDGYVYTSDYDVLFGQLLDHEFSIKGAPPASRSVVENLPSVLLTESIAKNNTLCAVCRDELSPQESIKQLPCLHHYHGDCILQWLTVRNTCPVCRYELPTDDTEYEDWKAQRGSSGGPRAALFELFLDSRTR